METALYLPVKRFLEKLGFTVKGEVGGCDLVALSGSDPPVVVIGELKLAFNLELILQAVDRAGAADEVWVAAKLIRPRQGPRERRALPQPLPPTRIRHAGGDEYRRCRGDRAAGDNGSSTQSKKAVAAGGRASEPQGDPAMGGSDPRADHEAYRQQALACARRCRRGRGGEGFATRYADAGKFLRNRYPLVRSRRARRITC